MKLVQKFKRKGVLLTIQILSYTCTVCQTPKIIQEGLSEKEIVEQGHLLKYPQFMQSNILFKNGMQSKALLNYNLLLGEMLFIDNHHDTLALADENTIQYINILIDTFYFDKQFLLLINGQAKIKLASHQRLIAEENKTTGAYGQRVPSSSVTSYNHVTIGNRITKIGVMKYASLKLDNRYFLGDKYNHFLPLNKKNVLKRFSKHQDKILEFLHAHSLNLNKEDDAIKLVLFLESLN